MPPAARTPVGDAPASDASGRLQGLSSLGVRDADDRPGRRRSPLDADRAQHDPVGERHLVVTDEPCAAAQAGSSRVTASGYRYAETLAPGLGLTQLPAAARDPLERDLCAAHLLPPDQLGLVLTCSPIGYSSARVAQAELGVQRRATRHKVGGFSPRTTPPR